jgi:hypothetical protein
MSDSADSPSKQPPDSATTGDGNTINDASTSQQTTQQQPHHGSKFDAHLVTSINRDNTLAAPQIDNIIEEDEEEEEPEEETKVPEKVKVIDFHIHKPEEPPPPVSVSTSTSSSTTAKPHESTIKFNIEPVVLATETAASVSSVEAVSVNEAQDTTVTTATTSSSNEQPVNNNNDEATAGK